MPKEQLALLYWHCCILNNEKNSPKNTTHLPKQVCGTAFASSAHMLWIVEAAGGGCMCCSVLPWACLFIHWVGYHGVEVSRIRTD
jgi:hypothetical protein